MDFRLGGSGSESIATDADEFGVSVVFWVDVVFHSFRSITRKEGIIKPVGSGGFCSGFKPVLINCGVCDNIAKQLILHTLGCLQTCLRQLRSWKQKKRVEVQCFDKHWRERIKSMKAISLMEMLKAGVHFGHKTSLWNPKMAPFIYTQRNNIHIIDLEKTKNKLAEATAYAKDLASRGGVILFVGTKRQSKDPVRKAAESCGMPYVVTRWLGGTFTNFRTIQRTVKKMERMERLIADNEIVKYTKKEQMMIKRELEKMKVIFAGIKDMKKLPEAIFCLDVKYDHIPVEEARQSKVKVLGLVDTNCDPSKIDYPIPSNDDAIKVITYMADAMAEAIREGKGMAAVPEAKTEPAPAEAAKK